MMEFPKILLSHDGRYLMFENTIYDSLLGRTINASSTDVNFWLNFLKENSIISYQKSLSNYSIIQKNIRETVYKISTFFSNNEKFRFLVEFESKFGDTLILEHKNFNTNINNIQNSWDFIIESVHSLQEKITEQESGGISSKISSGFNWLKEKGVNWFFEELRKALYSWGGAAVQTFLATFGAAFGGNVVLVIVWGAMLAYDIYQATQGNVVWTNIIISLIGVLTTGPGAKVVGQLFSKLGILGKNISLLTIFQKIGNTKAGTQLINFLGELSKYSSKITGYVKKGISMIAEKLNMGWLNRSSSSIITKLNSVMDEITIASSKIGKQTIKTSSKYIKPITQKMTQASKQVYNKTGQYIKPIVQGMKKGLSSKTGQIATDTGLTAGANKVMGQNNSVFGGAFTDENKGIINHLSRMKIDYDPNLLP